MRKFILRLIKLFVGLFIAALGVVFMVNANVGLPPWDVLHSGVGNIMNITIGQAIILVSIILTIISMIFGEKIGIGTIANVIFIGVFVDFIKQINLVTMGNSFVVGFIMMNIGMILLAIGSVIYISCEFCCGAKDAVTMAFTRKFNKPVKYVRSTLEIIAIVIGILIGGKFSVVTIYAALFFGYFMQTAFKIFKCNPQELNHLSIIGMFNSNQIIE